MSDSIYQLIARFFIFYLPLLFSLCVHEWSHAWMASFKGDQMARYQGRLSLNPLVHADLLGTVLLPLLSIFMGWPVFGWAKPVPVDPGQLKNPKQDMFWIAFAGPLSNFCLALIGTTILFLSLLAFYAFPVSTLSIFIQVLEVFILINLLLGFFNMIPLHPLDGAKVMARFLPLEWNLKLESWQAYTSLILIALFVTGAFRYLVFPSYWLSVQLISFAKWSSQIFYF